MARFISSRRRAKKAMPEVTLTPLIDTALTLLVIFMVASPMLHNAIRVTLPKGQAKEDGGVQHELVVTVDKEGKLFFNDEPVKNTENLIALIKKIVAQDKDRTVFVKADEAVRYGKVLELVDDIKVIGGVSYVALATQQT